MAAAVQREEALALSREIDAIHDAALLQWYDREQPPPAGDDLRAVVLAQHRSNFELWGLEDQARRRDVEDSTIAEIKRAIDATNQRRNDLMERVDELVLAGFADVDVATAELNSETAGQMVDRLSILALKIRNMRKTAERAAEPELAAECRAKVEVLLAQRADLVACLQRLLEQFAHGARYFKIYRQFKAYNDPRLNPALARRGDG